MRPFEQVVAQHGPAVLRVCRAVVGSVDAEDVRSETFLSALRAYPQLPADANGLLGNSPDAARRASADGIETLRKLYREHKRPAAHRGLPAQRHRAPA